MERAIDIQGSGYIGGLEWIRTWLILLVDIDVND